jgi:hypothetical protein
MNATVHAWHQRHSRALLAELVDAVDALAPQTAATDELAHDRDPVSIDRLERLAERFSGLSRLSLQAASALRRELDSPEAA